jgi:hypothetical protein
MKITPLVLLATLASGSEAARAQPLVPPPAAVAVAPPATGQVLTSPWLTTGWDDGLAEVATYDLAQVRYGSHHPGTATLIAVREAMDAGRAVKAVATGPTVPVLKLHWVRSFQTGVYRYEQSSFQLVRQADGVPLRWLITSHEWCGAAAKSWVNGGPLHVSSYFDGHGDVPQDLDLGQDAVPADSLWWWARAWSQASDAPATIRVIPSQIEARCVSTVPEPATVTRAATAEGLVITVQRGALRDRLLLRDEPARTLLRWDQADGSHLTLRKVRRYAYWQHHAPADRP